MKMTETKTGKAGTDFTKYFTDQVKDIYWAEKNVVPGIRKMCSATTNKELLAAFEKQLEESTGQLESIRKIFEIMEKRPVGKKCAAMEGLLKEADEAIEGTDDGSFVRDVALIMISQKIEHYEIATYGTLRVLAGYMPQAKKLQPLLAELLDQEKITDAFLTEVAQTQIYRQASKE